MGAEPAQECPPCPSRTCALPTNVSPGQEGDQLLPLKHLLLVFKVGEAFGRAAHQLKACNTGSGRPARAPPAHAAPTLRPARAPPAHTEASPPHTTTEDPEGSGHGEGTGLEGRGQGWLLTWDELVLPEKIQVPIQMGEVVAQALPS